MNKPKKAFPIILLASLVFLSAPLKHASFVDINNNQIALIEHRANKPFYAVTPADNFINMVNELDTVNRDNYLTVEVDANNVLNTYNKLDDYSKKMNDVIAAKTKLDAIIHTIEEYKHIEQFVESLHMDEQTEGQCFGYYNDVKTSYASLTPSEQGLFESGEYSEELARFHAWIIANGDEIIGGMLSPSGLHSSVGKGIYKDNLEIVALFLIVAAAVSLITTILVLVKKKKR